MKMWNFSQITFLFFGIALPVLPTICNGESCVFPFKYNGKLYYSCITINHRNELWCGTTFDYDKDGMYKDCVGKVREEIICSRDSRFLDCSRGTTIRVIDVIYGRVVGRDVCGINPASNCTADIFCDVSKSSNRKQKSPFLTPDRPDLFTPEDPCPKEEKYIVIKYICLKSQPTLDAYGENFALKKPASQSSTHPGRPASHAVDGNHAKNWQVCTHTVDTGETDPWWRVDLEQRVAVSNVKITNRNVLGERLRGFEIRIGDTAAKNGTQNARCGKPRDIPSNKAAVISCDPPLVGRYVTIVIPGNVKILTLCEVEVYGTSVLGRVNLAGARLTGSNLPYEGRVVLNGNTFCDLQWSSQDADTTCLQLGYPKASITDWNPSFSSSVIFSGNSPVVKDFNCTGAESSLNDCLQTVQNGETCTAEKTVTVRCQTFVRLRGSNIPVVGRVEVFHLGVWGTVCVCGDNQWRAKNGRVVCQELGFHDVTKDSPSRYESGSGKIWFENLQCEGDEKSLVFCKHSNWEDTRCSHNQDLAVECSICAQPLLKDRSKFPDTIFEASAYRSPEYSPSSGRLYSPSPWCLPNDNQDQFLEINFPGIFSLSAVATVGGSLGYVTSYKLSYSVNGKDRPLFAIVDKKQVIPGNTNNDTHNVIRREFDRSFLAHKIRMIPISWSGVPCMRVELCGKEIPLCNPPNIIVEKKTSTSVEIKWESLTFPGQHSPHDNYSVTLVGENYLIHTGNTFAELKSLRPFNDYRLIVIAAGFKDCFRNDTPITFRTDEDVPGAPPQKIKVKELGSESLTLTWAPPDVKNQNGIITNYSIRYSININKENCSNDDVSMQWAKTTSVRIENLQRATIYCLWIRAYTRIGPGPYTDRNKIVTSSGALQKPTKVTSGSFRLHLQVPEDGFSSIQIIVIRLSDSNNPSRSPHSYNQSEISTDNKPVGFLKPYVAVELQAAEVRQNEYFTVGDGERYPRSRKRRRRDEESKKSFFNRQLEPDSFYSAFQRTYQDENTYYSSFWTETIKTNKLDGENAVQSGDGGTWIGVGVGVAVLLIILLLVLLLILKRRRARPKNVDAGTTIGNIAAKVVPSATYEEVDDGSENVAMVKMDDEGDTDSESDAAGLDEGIYGNAEVSVERDPFRMVPVHDFEDYVRDMKQNKNYGFGQQYKELPQGVCFPCTIAKRPEHKPHNRYVNMISYDDALVRLSGDDGENYINASFISGTGPKAYIATQGPSAKTITAFWKMVWEQKSSVIVMLTNLKEKGKVKCTKYWPETSNKYGSISVRVESKQLYPYYVIHTLRVVKDGEERWVTHFHFTAWPDHGVPKYPTQLLAFIHSIKFSIHGMDGPIMVHCSAGIGRTGAFISIDHVLMTLSEERNGSVDVFGIVQDMRKCRVNMVQTLGQYIFIHDAILEYILCGVNEIEGYSLERTIEELSERNPETKKTGFEEQFQRLKNLSPILTKAECKTATMKVNTKKNRTPDIYPADSARVTLSRSSSSKDSDYINATFVSGYKQKNAYIATDHPLTCTFPDFWQMIYEQQSPLIIMLNNFKERDQLHPEYFPQEEMNAVKYGNYFVRLEKQRTEKAIISRTFSVSQTLDFKSPRTVRHFQYTQWPKGGVPSDTDELVKMIHSIQAAQRQNEQGPMVIHSSTGAGRTGTFITLSISMERLKTEQRVDVFQCIKLIREQRPQFVENTAQLQFCYQVLARYVKSFEGYSNFDPSEL